MLTPRLLAASACFVLTATLVGPAIAQNEPKGVGSFALPGVDRVHYAPPLKRNVAVAWSAGYGYTEGVLHDGDAHHRVVGTFAAGLAPVEWLGIAARYDLRYDRHSSNSGSDKGIASQSSYLLQAGGKLGPTFHLGGETVVWIPSGTTQTKAFDGTSLDMNLLATFLPTSGRYTLSGRAGFRLDNSRKAVGSAADRMSRADRLALNLNDNNALLLGGAVSWRLAPVELLGEWTWDVQVGHTAPSALESPMRLVAGVRWPFTRIASLQGLLGVSPSQRPAVQPSAPLVVVEPRFWINVGFALRWPWEDVAAVFAPPKGPRRSAIEGQVVDLTGKPIVNAEVKVADSSAPGTRTDAQGRFRLNDVELGPRRLSVCAPGWLCQTVPLTVGERANPPVPVAMRPLATTLRGVVLAANGEPVVGAKVWVGKGERGVQTTTDVQGRYELSELPLGEQVLKITAEGWDEHIQPIQLSALSAPVLTELKRPLPEGQIRGQVRSFGGKAITATIRIEPIGRELRTDSNGQFTSDIPPGDYQVTVQASGHHPQTRPVRVEHNGVTVLVIDLDRKRQ
jgi:hypothetical protein